MFVAGGLARATINAEGHSNQGKIGGAATFFVFLYTAIFGATWLTVPWLYPAEIFPLQVRAKGNAWGVVGWSIGNGWCVSSLSLSPVRYFHEDISHQLLRSCCFPPSLNISMRKHSTSSALLMLCPSLLSGLCIPSPISGRWKRWTSCLPAIVYGRGKPSAILPN